MIMTSKHRMEKERIIISSLFFNPSCHDFAREEEIPTNLFQSENHQKIMEAFSFYTSTGTIPSLSLMIDKLQPKDEEERLKYLKFFKLLKVKYQPEDLDQVTAHISSLKVMKELESLKTLGDHIIELYNKRTPAEIKEFIEVTLNDLDELYNQENAKALFIKDGVDLVLNHAKDIIDNPDASEYITTGYPEIDSALTGGYAKGTYTIIAGRPSMGKTLFMLCSAIAAARRGAKTLFISIEMTKLQAYQRIVSMISGVSSKSILEPNNLTPDDWKKLDKTSADVLELFNNRFILKEVSGLTPPQMERNIRQYKKSLNLDIAFVDYVQIMYTKNGGTPEKESDYNQISASCRRSSKVLDIALVLGSQLNRELERRVDKHPNLGDLRNSGAFEQDAARVIALYRDEYYNGPNTEKPGIIEVLILKNRFGRGGASGVSVDLRYDFDRNLIAGFAA